MQIFRLTFWRPMPPDPADHGGETTLQPEHYYVLGAHALSTLVAHTQQGASWQALHREAAPAEEEGGKKKKKKKNKPDDVLKSDPFNVFIRDAKMLKRAKKGLWLVPADDADVARLWTGGEATGLGDDTTDTYLKPHWAVERVSAKWAVDELSPKKLTKLLKSNYVQD